MLYSAENLWVTIPALDEQQWLPDCLASLASQTIRGFHVVICVNQPDAWWQDDGKRGVCIRNIQMLEWLQKHQGDDPYRLHVIDRSSPGAGWPRGRGGAGAARREAMNKAIRQGDPDIILVSTDADTRFDDTWLSDIRERFNACPTASAMAAPYYHKLTDAPGLDRAILRYELFMRFYLLNLIRIRSPFAFTAIGSAMAVTGKTYRRMGGMPVKPNGEDFYLLQKAAKTGRVLNWLPSTAYPAVRLSRRVGFGTGPALSAGLQGEWSRYPIIHPHHFDRIGELYQSLPLLYDHDIPTPVDPFLEEKFGTSLIWQSIRRNCRTRDTFMKACHLRFDGLRIWQMLRRAAAGDDPDEALKANLALFLPSFHGLKTGGLANADLEELEILRDQLFEKERQMRKASDETI